MQFYAYNVTTGDLIWGPTEPPDNDWDMYTLSSVIAYGKLYTASFGGRVYCFDLKTGKRLWTYYTGSSGYETVYGHMSALYASYGQKVSRGQAIGVINIYKFLSY